MICNESITFDYLSQIILLFKISVDAIMNSSKEIGAHMILNALFQNYS